MPVPLHVLFYNAIYNLCHHIIFTQIFDVLIMCIIYTFIKNLSLPFYYLAQVINLILINFILKNWSGENKGHGKECRVLFVKKINRINSKNELNFV